jgi:hypothetical protein
MHVLVRVRGGGGKTRKVRVAVCLSVLAGREGEARPHGRCC